ncbi:MAG: hypothetical protein QME96_15745, partial [Myxococcota bacterium]|nr:hypothetical protein [Myxococcota bacterium]
MLNSNVLNSNRMRSLGPATAFGGVAWLVVIGGLLPGCAVDDDPRAAAEDLPPGIAQAYFAEEDCCLNHDECQDGNFCNGRERCDCWGVCQPPDPTFNICYDADPCTSDFCDEALDMCPRTPVFGPGCGCMTAADCDDWNACTADVCDAAWLCQNTLISCDDGDICTTDSCNTATGCVNTPIPGCCTGDAYCNDSNPCTTDVCDVVTGNCSNTLLPVGTSCSDGLWCNGQEACNATGACMAGVPPCGLLCEACNETFDNCDVSPGYCRIGGACYASGATNPANQCQSCQPAMSQTSWTPKPAGTPCNDDLFCTLTDTCNATGTCVGAGARCPVTGCVTGCNEAGDVCTFAAAGTSCTDGLWCNGSELCNATGTCLAGTNPCVL